MAEGTYEYECMRAELLGVGKPDYEEWLQRQKEADENRRLAAEVEEEAVDVTNLEAAELQGEELKSTSGKFDDLNSILSATQKRLDRFKVRCGSVTEIIRTRIGGSVSGNGASASDDAAAAASATATAAEATEEVEDSPAASIPPVGERRTQLAQAMDNHVDALDSLINKAGRAEMALNNQNKQIKKFLK